MFSTPVSECKDHEGQADRKELAGLRDKQQRSHVVDPLVWCADQYDAGQGDEQPQPTFSARPAPLTETQDKEGVRVQYTENATALAISSRRYCQTATCWPQSGCSRPPTTRALRRQTSYGRFPDAASSTSPGRSSPAWR